MRHGKICKPPNVKWPVFAKPSILLTVASIMMIVLCCVGCVSTRKTTQQETRMEAVRTMTDSLDSEVRLIRTETVPKSEVKLEIQADSLMKLPPMASYSGKSGQANVSVSRNKDVITVYASCDSLQILVEYYEKKSASYQKAYEEMASLYETEVKQRSNPVKTFFCGFGIGILLSILTAIAIYINLKRNKDGK